MPRLHALELLLDADSSAVVRREWEALHEAGLPSQRDHTGATNAPHVTVVSAPELPEEACHRAGLLVGPLLPAVLRTSGLLLLGGEKVTVARALDVPDDLVEAVLGVRRLVASPQHASWLPHVTLARRVPRSDVARAVEVLGHDDRVLAGVELRRWDPDAGTVSTIVAT